MVRLLAADTLHLMKDFYIPVATPKSFFRIVFPKRTSFICRQNILVFSGIV